MHLVWRQTLQLCFYNPTLNFRLPSTWRIFSLPLPPSLFLKRFFCLVYFKLPMQKEYGSMAFLQNKELTYLYYIWFGNRVYEYIHPNRLWKLQERLSLRTWFWGLLKSCTYTARCFDFVFIFVFRIGGKSMSGCCLHVLPQVESPALACLLPSRLPFTATVAALCASDILLTTPICHFPITIIFSISFCFVLFSNHCNSCHRRTFVCGKLSVLSGHI